MSRRKKKNQTKRSILNYVLAIFLLPIHLSCLGYCFLKSIIMMIMMLLIISFQLKCNSHFSLACLSLLTHSPKTLLLALFQSSWHFGDMGFSEDMSVDFLPLEVTNHFICKLQGMQTLQWGSGRMLHLQILNTVFSSSSRAKITAF